LAAITTEVIGVTLTSGTPGADGLRQQAPLSTASQTIQYSACSGIATVQNQTGAGAALNVRRQHHRQPHSTSATLVFYFPTPPARRR